MAPKELMLSQPTGHASAAAPGASGKTNDKASGKSDPAAAYLGHISELRADGSLTVMYPGITTAIPARLAAAATRERIETAVLLQQSVVLLFEQGDPQHPLIIGFLSSVIDEPSQQTAPTIEADVDGKRVRVTGQDEIVLECGQASITLRRNGRVVIRGTHVETHSEGTNRIKGGQVRIN
jgi:hypothetical protein